MDIPEGSMADLCHLASLSSHAYVLPVGGASLTRWMLWWVCVKCFVFARRNLEYRSLHSRLVCNSILWVIRKGGLGRTRLVAIWRTCVRLDLLVISYRLTNRLPTSLRCPCYDSPGHQFNSRFIAFSCLRRTQGFACFYSVPVAATYQHRYGFIRVNTASMLDWC